MTAVVTSGAAAVPVIGVTVQFGVTGANPQTVPETTDPTGTATFPLQGANSGTDTVQASYGGATSNTATVSWLVPSPNVSTSTILGRFFPNPNNTGTFDVLPTATPVFSQYFPTILFNPPTGTVNNLACSIVNTNARPFTDVTTDATANFKGSVIAQGNGVQAGVGSLNAFEAVFTGQFTVKSAGSVTFNIYSDDGFILGLGGGATRVSGPMSNAPASGATPFNDVTVVEGKGRVES